MGVYCSAAVFYCNPHRESRPFRQISAAADLIRGQDVLKFVPDLALGDNVDTSKFDGAFSLAYTLIYLVYMNDKRIQAWIRSTAPDRIRYHRRRFIKDIHDEPGKCGGWARLCGTKEWKEM